jgi:ketosteroid isomerase-like protein
MPTARDVFTRLAEAWLGNPEARSFPGDLLADDVVIEMPLAPPGWPNRVEGRAQFVALSEAGRAATPLRFHECRDVIVHDTADVETLLVEYRLGGTVTTTGASVVAPVIALLHLQDGRIRHWREYQNIAALLP